MERLESLFGKVFQVVTDEYLTLPYGQYEPLTVFVKTTVGGQYETCSWDSEESDTEPQTFERSDSEIVRELAYGLYALFSEVFRELKVDSATGVNLCERVTDGATSWSYIKADTEYGYYGDNVQYGTYAFDLADMGTQLFSGEVLEFYQRCLENFKNKEVIGASSIYE